MKKWGILNYYNIAKALNRTPESVRVKATRLGYTNFVESLDGITLSEMSTILRIDSRKLNKWTKGLPGRSRFPAWSVSLSECTTIRLVNLDSFWKWAKNNYDLIDFSRLEKNALGAEPDWVGERRRVDQSERSKDNKGEVWTHSEERKLIRLVNKFKYTYKDLAKLMLRSEKSIYEKLLIMNVKARPLKAERKSWTEEETEMLLSLLEAGTDYTTIADKLERSETAIRGKYRKLKAANGRMAREVS